MHQASDGPQTKSGQQRSDYWLWNVLIQVFMRWKLSDLATLKLLNGIKGDIELAPYSLSAFFTLPEFGCSPVVSSAI